MITLTYLAFGQSGIATVSGDTITNITIKKSAKYTNQVQVTYLQENQTKTLYASEVLSYWYGKKYFSTYSIEGNNYLLSSILNGVVNLRYGTNSLGKTIYYVKLNSERDYTSLYPYRKDLSSFFEKYLDDFGSFRKEYQGEINYDRKRLGELISAYNAYTDPSKYQFTEFKYDSKSRNGFAFDIISNTARIGETDFDSKPSLRFSYFYEKSYVGSIWGFGTKLGFQRVRGDFELQSYSVGSIGLDPFILISVPSQSEIVARVQMGPSFEFNHSGEYNSEGIFSPQPQSTPQGFLLNPATISTGYFIALVCDFELENALLRFFSEYSSTALNFEDSNNSISFNDSILEGDLRQLTFGVGILF